MPLEPSQFYFVRRKVPGEAGAAVAIPLGLCMQSRRLFVFTNETERRDIDERVERLQTLLMVVDDKLEESRLQRLNATAELGARLHRLLGVSSEAERATELDRVRDISAAEALKPLHNRLVEQASTTSGNVGSAKQHDMTELHARSQRLLVLSSFVDRKLAEQTAPQPLPNSKTQNVGSGEAQLSTGGTKLTQSFQNSRHRTVPHEDQRGKCGRLPKSM